MLSRNCWLFGKVLALQISLHVSKQKVILSFSHRKPGFLIFGISLLPPVPSEFFGSLPNSHVIPHLNMELADHPGGAKALERDWRAQVPLRQLTCCVTSHKSFWPWFLRPSNGDINAQPTSQCCFKEWVTASKVKTRLEPGVWKVPYKWGLLLLFLLWEDR